MRHRDAMRWARLGAVLDTLYNFVHLFIPVYIVKKEVGAFTTNECQINYLPI